MPIYKCTAFNTCMSWFLFINYFFTFVLCEMLLVHPHMYTDASRIGY